MINHYLPDKCVKLKYTKFENVFKGRFSIILKQDVKVAFQNIHLTFQLYWLYSFSWENNIYMEKCLSFDFSTSSYLINL